MFLCLRLENVEGEWYIQYAEASVLQEFPRERVFFEKSFRVLKVVLNSAVGNVMLHLTIALLAN